MGNAVTPREVDKVRRGITMTKSQPVCFIAPTFFAGAFFRGISHPEYRV
jgi:hypothetical protein